MQKKMMLLGAAFAAVLTMGYGALTVSASEPLAAPTEEITIDGKKPARFNHTTHLGLGMDCAVCHHDKDYKPLTAEAIGAMTDAGQLSCVSCHNDSHPKPELQSAKDVFHARCKECHTKGYEGKTGPTKCNDCHVKAKKAVEGC